LTPQKSKSAGIILYTLSANATDIGFSPLDNIRKHERVYKGSKQGTPKKAKTGASIMTKAPPTSAKKMTKGMNKVTEEIGKSKRAQARGL